MSKFMQSLDQEMIEKLEEIGNKQYNGMIIQELIRHIIIPDWLKKNGRVVKREKEE